MGEGGWPSGTLLGLDLETTGVRRHGDVPVSFALVRYETGRAVARRSGIVDPGRPIPAGATAVHGITTERARREGMPLRAALELLRDALVEAGRTGVPVVGMNLSYDLSLLDHQLLVLTGAGLREAGWDGPVLDLLVLDRHLDRYRRGKRQLAHLCAHYAVALGSAHEAGADAEAAVLVLLALCERFPELAHLKLAELTRSQATWHRDWAADLAAHRARDGLPLDVPHDDGWPVARDGRLGARPPTMGVDA